MTAAPKLSTGGMAAGIPLEDKNVALDPLIAKPASLFRGLSYGQSTTNGTSKPDAHRLRT
jgi:hypothetical protein